MHPNEALVQRFYQAFQRRDGDAMAACYAPDARFSDPVFTDLEGALVGDMWRMLCARGKDLVVEFSDLRADDVSGRARWDARYTFSQTGRAVHNVIDARFTFRDGLIAEHRDDFDLQRWMSQALGLSGTLLGWLPPFRRALQRKARGGLDQWRAKRR